ncbi:mechanosensitive ion channel family protein [Marinococcus halophilus]|uniref:Putative MscS family protein YkuT n=1 Tax=Marinococcus halophilus TaxID=1371 RepID=A0A510Y3V1_MARHA|nr:mechanosensitive ion channel family protein [Marinococcus halophilus]OZT81304.1 mechanosensitive ion channel family protein [Marinococcus halophilus]GEK57247.1 putative MscS family protein YkuT [Marinococcus halophilus]
MNMESFNDGVFWAAAIILIVQLVGVLIGYIIVRAIGSKIIHRAFNRMEKQRNMHPGRVKTLSRLAISIFTYILLFIVITITLGLFDLDIAPLIASAGIVGLAIGFGAQGLVSDVVTGFFILLEKQIDVEDYIAIAGIDGIVEEVGLRTTQVRSFDGTLHFVPNREISVVSNYSRGNMQAIVDIGIAYEENVDKAIAVIQGACNRVAEEQGAFKEGPDVVGVNALGSSEVTIRIIAKTENMMQWAMQRELLKACKEELDAHNIEIPYPHQVNVSKEA